MEEGELKEYWRDTWIPECRCPHCGIVVNGAANLNGYTPKPGDPTICIECLEISQFATDLTLEPITDENLLAPSLVEIQKIRRFLITASIMEQQRRGQYRVIRIDGTETVVHEKPTMGAVYEAIGCDGIDTVILTRGRHQAIVVMLLDDTGMIDGKPVNEKATAMVREVFGPAYPYSIHGNVVIANDEDFA